MIKNKIQGCGIIFPDMVIYKLARKSSFRITVCRNTIISILISLNFLNYFYNLNLWKKSIRCHFVTLISEFS